MNFLLFIAAAAAAAPAPALGVPPCAATLSADIEACDPAIAGEADTKAKARLFFQRAYALNEKHRYEDAVRDLTEALRLDPDYADALHERAYTLGELSEYDRALEDSDREIALRPDLASAYEERAFLRHRSGDLAGAHSDRARAVQLKPADPGAMIARGGAALWLGRFDDAARDTTRGLRLAEVAKDEPAAANARQQLALIRLWRKGSGGSAPATKCTKAIRTGEFESAGLAGDCTAAFLAARSPADKAEFLSTRAMVWLAAHQDQTSAIGDQIMAVALEPGNADWRANLGGSYIMARHSWAGRRELDRALAIKESWPALAQRAAARFNLNEPDGALADARRSIELEPNELALTVLGDLSKDRGDLASAKQHWLGAYRLGGRGDGLIERLKSVGIDHPDREALGK